MNLRRILLSVLTITLITIAGLVAAWRFLGGEAQVRGALIDYLRRRVNPTISIQRISPRPTRLLLRGVSANLSPTMTLSIRSVEMDISPYRLLLAPPPKVGAIREIRIIKPTLRIGSEAAGGDASANGLPSWSPQLLKKLIPLRTVTNVIISGGEVVYGDNDKLLEDITGAFTVSDSGNVDLHLESFLAMAHQATVSASGEASLATGDFRANLALRCDSLNSIRWDSLAPGVKVSRGGLQAQLEIVGDTALHSSGSCQLAGLESSFGKVSLECDTIRGSLDLRQVRLSGEPVVDGINLPLTAAVKWSPDLLWEVSLKGTASLDSFAIAEGTPVGLKGNAAIDANATGGREEYHGTVSLASPELRYLGISARDLHLAVSDLNGVVKITEGHFGIGPGSLDFSGLVYDPHQNVDLGISGAWRFRNPQQAKWMKKAEYTGNLSLRAQRSGGLWDVTGGGDLTSESGERLLASEISSDGKKAWLTLTSPGDSAFVRASWNLSIDNAEFELYSTNPQNLAARLAATDALPVKLKQYRLDVDGSGSLESARATIVWYRKSGNVGGRLSAQASRRKGGGYDWGWGLILDLARGRSLDGIVSGTVRGDELFVEHLKVSDSKGKSLIAGNGQINLSELSPPLMALSIDSLPIVELTRYLSPEALPSFSGWLTAKVTGTSDSLDWTSGLTLVYPDSNIMRGQLAGDLVESRLHLTRATITDSTAATLLSLSGDIDFQDRTLQSVALRTENFPAARLIQIIYPDKATGFGGNLNALVQLDGPFSSPQLSADAHLSGGQLFGIPGYWLNMHLTSDDTTYRLDNFDIGRDVAPIAAASGIVDRRNGGYRFTLNGNGVDAGVLGEMLTGSRPISGMAHLSATAVGGNVPQMAKVAATVGPGRFGGIAFDAMQVGATLSGLDSGGAHITLDSARVLFGGAQASARGDVNLEGDKTCSLSVAATGRLTDLLPRTDEFFSQPTGSGEFALRVGGTTDHLRITGGHLRLDGGSFRMADVVHRIDHISVNIDVDSLGRVQIHRFDGKIGECWFRFGNRHPTSGDSSQPLILGGMNLGILTLRTDGDGIWAVIPSLMEPDWGGFVSFSGLDGDGAFEFRGPAQRPYGVGRIGLRNTTLTFPFLDTGGPPSPFARWLLALLERMHWDARLVPDQNCRYIREVSGFREIPLADAIRRRLSNELIDLDIKLYLDMRIDDETDGLLFTGSNIDTLHISGDLISEQGTVEYLDMKFQVDKAGVIFSPADIEPLFYGQASTTVTYPDSVARSVSIIVTEKRSPDSETTTRRPVTASHPVRWDELNFELHDEQGNSQERILGLMGYSLQGLSEKLPWLGGKLVTNATPLRRWTRVLEHTMEHFLGLDLVDIEPMVAGNIIQRQLDLLRASPVTSTPGSSYWSTLDQSRVSVGKYLTRDLYLSYTGSFHSEETYNVTRLGVVHEWDLMLRLSRLTSNLSVNYRYEYSTLAREAHRGVFLRYGFLFNI